MKRPPSLCQNKAKDFAYVYINRKQVYLGKWGSAEAQGAYDRLRCPRFSGLLRVIADIEIEVISDCHTKQAYSNTFFCQKNGTN